MPMHNTAITREIEACEDELRLAMLAGDVTALDDLLDDALIFTNQAGLRLSKQDDLAAHRSGLLAVDKLDASDRTITLAGDAAMVCVAVDLSGRYDGQGFAGRFAYTRVWRHAGEAWRVAVAHCSAMASA